MGSDTRKLLIIGDSLTFGRPKHNIFLEDTWPQRVVDRVTMDLWHRGRGGVGLKWILENELPQLVGYLAEADHQAPARRKSFYAGVIQLGIVDATPRVFSARQVQFFKIVGLWSLLSKIEVAPNLVKVLGRPGLSPSEFGYYLREIKSRMSVICDRCFFLEIGRPVHHLIDNKTDFSETVSLYNKIARDVFSESFISLYSGNPRPDLFLLDGHHLNRCGHVLVAEKVVACLDEG